MLTFKIELPDWNPAETEMRLEDIQNEIKELYWYWIKKHGDSHIRVINEESGERYGYTDER